MEKRSKNLAHLFHVPWYAGDEDTDTWPSYLHRNLHHVEGEEVPFRDSSWLHSDDDANHHDKILQALYESREVDASQVKVLVLKGKVWLWGSVDHESEKLAAEKIVSAFPETWSIVNEINF